MIMRSKNDTKVTKKALGNRVKGLKVGEIKPQSSPIYVASSRIDNNNSDLRSKYLSEMQHRFDKEICFGVNYKYIKA